ncbi:ABC transporter substrate-binding protein [Glycomyces xiaoerkulensis]|uniref:ABC transporter substrate-binding protein n=1 Tax=Glycomyces xiaoerkulensis TaxID=2038139 RepID=UPI000C26A504|nr:ABC transporter substrate-binding protein [Glycomyces xiaoerkulensis]
MPFEAERFTLARRRLLTGGGALGLTGVLAACGSGDDEDDAAESSGSWSFTDDRGETAELDTTPTELVAYTGMAAALHDFGVTVKGVFGPTTKEDGSLTTQAGDLPVEELTVIGNTYGEFDIEAYAALAPQVLSTHYYGDPSDLWYVPAESLDEISDLAPVVAIDVNDGQNTLPEVIERHAELAASLGADLESEAVEAAKERFDEAVEALRQAAADNPVKVLACSAGPEDFWASNPDSANDMRFFTELGVDFIVPDDLDEGGYYETLAWENADKYDADLIFLDAREQAIQPDGLADFPTWNALPAVQAGQIAAWDAEPLYGYGLAERSVRALAEAIANAEKLF